MLRNNHTVESNRVTGLHTALKYQDNDGGSHVSDEIEIQDPFLPRPSLEAIYPSRLFSLGLGALARRINSALLSRKNPYPTRSQRQSSHGRVSPRNFAFG